jgi:hypothetical protein
MDAADRVTTNDTNRTNGRRSDSCHSSDSRWLLLIPAAQPLKCLQESIVPIFNRDSAPRLTPYPNRLQKNPRPSAPSAEKHFLNISKQRKQSLDRRVLRSLHCFQFKPPTFFAPSRLCVRITNSPLPPLPSVQTALSASTCPGQLSTPAHNSSPPA